jgi:ATP-dependent RNA helicase DDX51/DBP6
MARGMDIENVKYVISYDPPPFIKTYIHRVGRTARAGKVGTAITMLQRHFVSLCTIFQSLKMFYSLSQIHDLPSLRQAWYLLHHEGSFQE